MNIYIRNCNNIVDADVFITAEKLNVKYAVNGSGKSTIAKAIKAFSLHDEELIENLTPYKFIGSSRHEDKPSVIGLPENVNIAVFDEFYVNQYVFQENELLKDSFNIFIKTKEYDKRLTEINKLIASVHKTFEDTPELEKLMIDMNEFISIFGNSKSGIAKNKPLSKGMSNGNLIDNIPQGLEEYSPFLTNERNSQWLKWQETGRDFMTLSDRCPFCATSLILNKEKIERIKNEYDSKNIEHLSKILSLFERLGAYFSNETNERLHEITTSVKGLSEEQENYLVEVKEQVVVLYDKIQKIKNLNFDSLKNIDKLTDVIHDYKISLEYLPYLCSEHTQEKITIVNNSISELINKVGKLQGAVMQQKREIENTVKKYNKQINEFLHNAGYEYTFSIDETQDHSYRIQLKFDEKHNCVQNVRYHLSFGERNALALVLFMYHAIYKQANFIVLDDPISSFDKNKKFAILDMLFIRGKNSFRGKTTLLLTHDFEPVIDTIYNHSDFFQEKPEASFMENNNGILHEIPINKEDIISAPEIARRNIEKASLISQIIYLRRYIEIIHGKNFAWHLLSSLLHKRDKPTIGKNGSLMTETEIKQAVTMIQDFIHNFQYEKLYRMITNHKKIIELYDKAASNYEKLQIYRILFDPKKENKGNHILRKFLNETYHVENDYLFQLNPLKFNTIPNFIIEECNKFVKELQENLN